MRRIVFLFSSLFIFFLFFASWSNGAYAQASCQLSTDQTIFSPDYQGDITIKGNGNCFVKRVTYIILSYPKNTPPSGYSNYIVRSQKFSGTTDEITVGFNLFFLFNTMNVQYVPGQWTIKVCGANNPTDQCGDSSGNVLGNTIPIIISAVPTPIPTPTPIPSNLPKVSVFPNQCVYKIGSPLEFLLDNLQPNTSYLWWWYGEFSLKNNTLYTNGSNPSLSLTIPSDETKQIGTRTFCISKTAETSTCYPGTQNSVTLQFIANPPPVDGSACITTSMGGQSSQTGLTPTPTLPAPPPPCSQWTNLSGTPIPTTDPIIQDANSAKKCAVLDTGLGIPISTDAGALVKSVFGVILSLSGGIALILIIISGYSLIFSQGNPEQVKAAQEQLTSAIVGLLFIIFSLVILQIIGADILKIPGFNP